MIVAPSIDTDQARSELEALFNRLRSEGRNDAAWCVADAGQFLLGSHAPSRVAEFAEKYRTKRPRRASTPLDDEAWLRHLYHPQNDPYVGKVFESVLAPIRNVRTRPISAFGLSPRTAVDPATSSMALAKAMGVAATTLNVPAPLIFARPDLPGGLAYMPSDPIASLAGAGHASGRSLAELAFVCGHHMTRYRSDLYATVLYSQVEELSTLFLSIIKLGHADLALPTGAERTADALRALVARDPSSAKMMHRIVSLFVERAEIVDLSHWLVGVEMTALRAGFLLSGDLRVASKIVPLLPGVPHQAMADLSTFAMSEEYFALRQRTGIALWKDGESRQAEPLVRSESDYSGSWDAVVASSPTSVVDFAAALRSVEVPEPEAPRERRTTDIAALDPVSLRAVEMQSTEVAVGDHPTHDAALAFESHSSERMTDRAYYAAVVWSHRSPADVSPSARAAAASGKSDDRWPTDAKIHPDDWEECVRDPGEISKVGSLILALTPAIQRSIPRTPEDYGFGANETSNSELSIAPLMDWAASLLDAPKPLVFGSNDIATALARPPCDPPITLVHRESLAALSHAELAFMAAEHVAYFRPERIARVLVSNPVTLAMLARTAIETVLHGSTRQSSDPLIRNTINVLLSDSTYLDNVRECAAAVVDFARVHRAVEMWCLAAERSAARAALWVTLDFDVARRVFEMDRGAPKEIPTDEKLSILGEFALSAKFAESRSRARAKKS